MDPSVFYNELKQQGFTFFTGVPDSLLKAFCAYIQDNAEYNIITANEGNAVALAAGHYLGSKKPALVYMQNSGLGNAVNPLISLIDEDVYKIPVLLLIGWRGEPGVHDEPQHMKQGKVTLGLLEELGIEYSILQADSDPAKLVQKAMDRLTEEKPFAIVVKKGAFSEYKLKNTLSNRSDLEKEKALEVLLEKLPEKSLCVSTTGKLSRELFELREKRGECHDTDFLTVGSMGHTSHIALGVALARPEKQVYCLDGDGSFLMHMGASPIIASQNLRNLKYIVFNNGAHDSVGGQPTSARDLQLSAIAKSCGFSSVKCVSTVTDLERAAEELASGNLDFLEILVKKGSRKNLGRPTVSPQEAKINFMGGM